MSLAAHMVEHSLLVSLVAPVLVLGTPLARIRRRSPAGPRSRARASLVRPLVVWPMFVVAQWVAHVPVVIDAVEAEPALHAAEHTLLLATAIAFWTPALDRVPAGSRRLGPGGRALYLFAAVPAIDLAAVILMVAGEPGAGVAMLAGMMPLALAAVWASWRWIVTEERVTRAAEGDGRPSEPRTAIEGVELREAR